MEELFDPIFSQNLPLKDRIMRQVCRGEGGLCESNIGMLKHENFKGAPGCQVSANNFSAKSKGVIMKPDHPQK